MRRQNVPAGRKIFTLLRGVSLWTAILAGACLPALAYNLPTTGQTYCYSDTAQITCPQPGEEYYGQDGYYQAGTPMRYTVQGTNADMVLDNVTGLTWLRAPYGRDYYVDCAAYCEALSLNGYDDWRVPSERELVTILDIGKASPKWNTVFTGGYTQAAYFSSNAYSGDMTQQIGVDFNTGSLIIHAADTLGYMRCVRGEPLMSTYSGGAGTVTDDSTGLMWQNPGSEAKYAWKEALAYCEGLSLGGHSDWRLPNYKELLSIVDYTTNSPAIGSPFSAYADSYWTSSTRYEPSVSIYPQNGIYVDFSSGYASYYFSKSYTNHVRCVRGGTTNNVVAVLANTPSSPTASHAATITVGGTGVVAYKYSLDSGDWSEATSIFTPIALSGLAMGTHTLSVIGENGAGVWQAMDAPTTARWTVIAATLEPVYLLLLGQ